MLSGLNPFAAKAPEQPPPAPGLFFKWTKDQLQRAMVSGDCKDLMKDLPALAEVIEASPPDARHQLRLCNSDTVTAACGGLMPYCATLLTMHASSASAARFTSEVITIVAPLLRPGALVCTLRPLLEGVAALQHAVRAVDAENARKWFYETQLPRDRDALYFAALAIALSAADAVESGVSLAGIGDAHAQLRAATSLVFGLPKELSAASVVGPLLHAAERLVSTPDGVPVAPGESAFIELCFGCASQAGRRLFATDSAALRRVAHLWLHTPKAKAGPAKIATAACLASLWRSQSLSSEVADVDALVRCGTSALSAGSDGDGICKACALALADVYAATSFPTASELEGSDVREFMTVTLRDLVMKRADVIAAAFLAQKWFGLTLHRTLPRTVSRLIAQCAVDCSAGQLLVVLREWPQGVGHDVDQELRDATTAVCGVLCQSISRAATAAPDDAPYMAAPLVAEVKVACIAAVTRSAFHPLPALLRLLWCLWASDPESDTLRASQTILQIGQHLHRASGAATRGGDAATVVESMRALTDGAATNQAWVTPAVGAEIVHALFPVLGVAAPRGGPWSAVTHEAAVALSALSTQTATHDAVVGVSVRRLRLLAQAYKCERGWLKDGPAVAAIDRLLSPTEPLRKALSVRRDVRSAIAFSDPSTYDRACLGVLCVGAVARRQLDGAAARCGERLPRSIERRIIDFAGDGYKWEVATSCNRGGQFLTTLAM